MNLKSLLATALTVIALASCTKEVIKEVPVDGGEDTGTTIVKFTLDANMVKTKGTNDHGSLTPTSYENQIYNYALFIFKSDGMLEATLKAQSSALNNPLAPDASGLLGFTQAQNPDLEWDGDGIVISSGIKTFFAIVNAPKEYVDAQNSFINNTTLTLNNIKQEVLTLGRELNKIVGEYGDESTDLVWFDNPVTAPNADNRGFLMTNIVTTTQPDGFYRQRLDEVEEGNPAIPVTVSVGRAMAKVSLASDLISLADIPSTGDSKQPNGALEVDGYKIINNPNKMNVVLDMSNGLLMTPDYTNSSVTNNYYFTSNNTSHGTDYIEVSKNPDKTFTYCIENANQTPRYGNATIAEIKGYFTPLGGTRGNATIVDPSTSTFDEAPLDASGDFWRIWIKPYTNNGVDLGGDYVEEYFISDPSAALDDFVTYAGARYPGLTDENLEVYAYPAGLCYYYLPLKNDESESPYSVQRNSYYKINIDSVSGPGYPDDGGEPGGPDKPGPEIPIEAQTLINASIKVEDWNEVNQTGNL